jgi:two-component system response regulator FlrC
VKMNTVLIVEDDVGLREALCDTLQLAGYAVAQASDGDSALKRLKDHSIGLVVTDIQMKPMDGNTFLEQLKLERPELPVLVMTAYGTIEGAVRALRAGAADYLTKPFQVETLLERVSHSFLDQPTAEDSIIACDSRSRELLHLARRVAQSEVTVLITGESGTGKEALAQFIHRSSRRAQGPFVAVNCAAIPENLLEATLFGYEKGAFTGAYRSCPGKFELAQGGTLLLDEVSEMALNLQAKLLRVLQEREVERVGGRQAVKLDVRLLATSNRNLSHWVSEGRLREDLYYRLNVFPLHVPPLRERPNDIVPLAMHLLRRLARDDKQPSPRLSEPAIERLLAHAWPGNVRELDNVMQRAVILQPGSTIGVDALRFESHDIRLSLSSSPALGDDLKSREQELILNTLQEVMGDRQATANRLRISPRTLRYKLARMREAGIDVPEKNPMENLNFRKRKP